VRFPPVPQTSLSRLPDVKHGNAAASNRGYEAEDRWRVFTPVLSAESSDRVPLRQCPAGSDVPDPRWQGGTS
jgi:glucose-6-phosphate 1-dehydrogenase